MKWKVKPIPRDGDERFIKRFALFPIRVRNNKMVWFEWYGIRQSYARYYGWYSLEYLEI